MEISPDEGKPMGYFEALRYLYEEGEMSKVDWFWDNVMEGDAFHVEKSIIKNKSDCITFANFIKSNYELTEQERVDNVLDILVREGSSTIVIGVRGSGKTCAVMSFAERLLARGQTVYWYGYHPELEKQFPDIKQSFDWLSFKEGTIITDEGAMLAQAREAMTKQAISRVKRFATVRHKGQSLIFIVQNIMDIDVSIFRNSTLIWFKATPFGDIFQRSQKDNLGISSFFKYIIPQDSHTEKEKNAVYNRESKQLYTFNNIPPSKWNDDMSKPFKLIKSRDIAKRIYFQMENDNVDPKTIHTMMEAYGWNLSRLFKEEIEMDKQVVIEKKMKEKAKPSLLCPKCNSSDFKLYGKLGPKQRYMCNRCGKTWS